MTGTVTLTTYREQEVVLPTEDAQFIGTRLSDKIQIKRSLAGANYVLDPHQYAGVVALPSGLRLEVAPRIPTRNLLYMIAVAYHIPWPWLDELERYETITGVLEPVVEHFADLVGEQVAAGVYRAYVEVEGSVPAVRGRIDFPRDVAENSAVRQGTYCRFADLTWDVPENQVVRWTCYLLANWSLRSADLRRRLQALEVQLNEVSLRPWSAAEAASFVYHRLNAPYERLHRLCALLLDASSVSENSGESDFRTFLLDMNLLYEQFVTESLIRRVPAGCSVRPQERHFLDTGRRVTIQPDLAFHRGRDTVLVADCKYKPHRGDADRVNADYYQLLAYCVAMNLRLGLLLYPETDAWSGPDCAHVAHAGIELRRIAVPLGESIDAVNRELDRLSSYVWDTASSESPAA